MKILLIVSRIFICLEKPLLMERISMKIRCPECKNYFNNKEQLYLDTLNTLRHKSCYSYSLEYIKDSGTFGELKNKYFFLNEHFEH